MSLKMDKRTYFLPGMNAFLLTGFVLSGYFFTDVLSNVVFGALFQAKLEFCEKK